MLFFKNTQSVAFRTSFVNTFFLTMESANEKGEERIGSSEGAELGWEYLDVELFCHILSAHMFQSWELHNILLTCKRWHYTLSHNDAEHPLWRPLMRFYFGGEKSDSETTWKQFYLVTCPCLFTS